VAFFIAAGLGLLSTLVLLRLSRTPQENENA
jgi:hypothetical protein